MSTIALESKLSCSLAFELKKRITRVSLSFTAPNSVLGFVTLWRADDDGLRLSTDMHDVTERREVGVLKVERVTEPRPNDVFVDLSSAYRGDLTPSKLVIQESGTTAESGIALAAATGEELVIVAAAYPYSLAVKGLATATGSDLFNPEYPLEKYTRIHMT